MSPIRPPRTLEELLDREEALAERGIARGAEQLGQDARDALNLRHHFQRHPFKTSAILGGLGVLLGSFARGAPRRRRGRSPILGLLVRSLLGTSLTGAVASRVAKAFQTGSDWGGFNPRSGTGL